MGYINVNIDDDLEIKVREALPKRTEAKGKHGALKQAVEEALEDWLKKKR